MFTRHHRTDKLNLFISSELLSNTTNIFSNKNFYSFQFHDIQKKLLCGNVQKNLTIIQNYVCGSVLKFFFVFLAVNAVIPENPEKKFTSMSCMHTGRQNVHRWMAIRMRCKLMDIRRSSCCMDEQFRLSMRWQLVLPILVELMVLP